MISNQPAYSKEMQSKTQQSSDQHSTEYSGPNQPDECISMVSTWYQRGILTWYQHGTNMVSAWYWPNQPDECVSTASVGRTRVLRLPATSKLWLRPRPRPTVAVPALTGALQTVHRISAELPWY
jgi:hypothetical protein